MADQGGIKLEKFTPEAKQLVAGAQQLADDRRHQDVLPLHLLARGVASSPAVRAVLKSAGADPVQVGELCERALGRLPTGDRVAYLSARMIDLLDRAEREAAREKLPDVGIAQLLHALAQEIRGAVGEILGSFGIEPGGFRDHVAAIDKVTKIAAAPRAADASELLHDLVAAARADKFDPLIGRDGESRRLLQILERRFKNHPIIVGEPGVGKTALIRGLAHRIAQGDVPTNLARARLLELDTGALAGPRMRGETEARLKAVTDKLAGEGEPILVVEELHALFSGVSSMGMGELLKPLLARGEIRILATTTPDGAQKIEERDGSLMRRFSVLTLEPAPGELAEQILRGIASRYEEHHRVQIAEGAVRTAVALGKRYVAERALPDSAVDLLDETAARKRVEYDGTPAAMDVAMRRLEAVEAQLRVLADDESKLGVQTRTRLDQEAAELRPRVESMRAELASYKQAPEGTRVAAVVVDENDVALTVNEWTGIPVAKMLEGEADKLLKMEERLGKKIIGQDEACAAVARAVRRGRVGLRDPGKPIGSFLFLGPSGVGKTYFAKKLAEFLFDDEQAMTRLDMSEFMEKHMAQRLIGSPPGYADSEQGGFLTEAARQRPYSVLLFDEVEKAHADVFNLLLQLLDDGRLTDGRGRTADFSNMVVIMTSNIGSKRILETDPKLFESEEGREAVRDVVRTELANFFRPELLNRIDDVIIFKGLTKKDLRGIAEVELGRVQKMLTEREVVMQISDAVKDRLVELGYEPALGARPLKRAILREIQNPLAEALLKEGVLGSGVVAVEMDGEKVVFRKAGAPN